MIRLELELNDSDKGMLVETPFMIVNNVDSDKMLHFAASYLGLNCLLISR